jgi:hypothetical protein
MDQALTYEVTPDQYIALSDLNDRSMRIDGSFDEGIWFSGLVALLGRDVVLSWIGRAIQIVVNYG